MMPFFSKLLPEAHMPTYLVERGGVNPVHEFFLLWVLGIDLPGAITIKPTDGEVLPPATQNDAQGEQDTEDDVRHKNVL